MTWEPGTVYVKVARCGGIVSCEAVVVEYAAGEVDFDVRLDIFEDVGREHLVEINTKLTEGI